MTQGAHWMDRVMHDLRGPLMPLQTAAYLLKHERGQLDAQREQELIDIIQRQSQRMARMLVEFGDWTRAQQQRLLRVSARCEIPAILDQAIGAVPGCAIDPVLDARCAVACVNVDELRLVQALGTLVGYSHARDATTTLHAGCANMQLTLLIRDRGVLLDPAQIDTLLDQPEAAPRDEGLGLGMMLARSIFDGHGGSVRATSMADGLLIACQLPLADEA